MLGLCHMPGSQEDGMCPSPWHGDQQQSLSAFIIQYSCLSLKTLSGFWYSCFKGIFDLRTNKTAWWKPWTFKKNSYIYCKNRFWCWKAVEKVKIKVEVLKVDSRWQQHKVCKGRWGDDSFLGISSRKQKTASVPLSALCWYRCRMKSNRKKILSISSSAVDGNTLTCILFSQNWKFSEHLWCILMQTWWERSNFPLQQDVLFSELEHISLELQAKQMLINYKRIFSEMTADLIGLHAGKTSQND